MSDRARYSDLSPLSMDEKINLSVLACKFFSPLANSEMHDLIGKPKQQGVIRPLDGGDFIHYLEKSGQLASASRKMYRIVELLRDLAAAHILTDMGPGKAVIMGSHYYFAKELTNKQKEGLWWFAETLGGEFVYHQFAPAALHITGKSTKGDIVAGTGIAIDDCWILTCAHVLNDMTVDETQHLLGGEYKILECHSHPEIDVGLVKVDKKLFKLPGLAFADAAAGLSVYTIGFPRVPLSLEAMPIMHRGEVTVPSLKTFQGHELFLYSAIARPGNSGGPIVGKSGTVVGIVTEELCEESSKAGLPFYAGVPSAQISRAIEEMCPSVRLPVESYK